MKNKHDNLIQRAYCHVKRHRKKYIRFILFIIILSLFRVIEDYFWVRTMGIEFEIDVFILFGIIFIAITFTVISELTEKMVEKEEPIIERFIKKEECIIEDKEKEIESKIKRKSKRHR